MPVQSWEISLVIGKCLQTYTSSQLLNQCIAYRAPRMISTNFTTEPQNKLTVEVLLYIQISRCITYVVEKCGKNYFTKQCNERSDHANKPNWMYNSHTATRNESKTHWRRFWASSSSRRCFQSSRKWSSAIPLWSIGPSASMSSTIYRGKQGNLSEIGEHLLINSCNGVVMKIYSVFS